MMIFESESADAVKRIIEDDVFWTESVVGALTTIAKQVAQSCL